MSLWDKIFGGKKPKAPQPDDAGQTLTDITRGMQHAVNRAQEMLERHFIEVLDRYFIEDKDGKQYPKILSFKLPGKNVMHVPLISLVPAHALSLDEMDIKMAVRIDSTKTKKAGPHEKGEKDHLTRTSFAVSFTPMKSTGNGGTQERDMNAVEVTMRFKRGDPPEGVARVLEQYINTVIPVPRKDDDDPQGLVRMDEVAGEGKGKVEDFNGASDQSPGVPPGEPPAPSSSEGGGDKGGSPPQA